VKPGADPPRLDPRSRWEFADGEAPVRIPPGFAALCCGGLALLVSLAGWVPQVRWLLWFDLPFAVLLFVVCAWLALGELRRVGRVLPGLLLALLAVLLSAAHLLTDRAHPWAR
jgi:hypothetical protein